MGEPSSTDDKSPAPFDPESWLRMVKLVDFLDVLSMPPEVQDRVGQAIVLLRLSHPRDETPAEFADGLSGDPRRR